MWTSVLSCIEKYDYFALSPKLCYLWKTVKSVIYCWEACFRPFQASVIEFSPKNSLAKKDVWEGAKLVLIVTAGKMIG